MAFTAPLTIDNIVTLVIKSIIASLVCFRTLLSLDICRIQSQGPVECCAFWETAFVSFSRLCKKQTPVSHSSAEAEIISLDGGLRMEKVPAWNLWECVVGAFSSANKAAGVPTHNHLQWSHITEHLVQPNLFHISHLQLLCWQSKHASFLKNSQKNRTSQTKEHGNTSNDGTLKITCARWPLGREDACLWTVTMEPCSRAALLHHDRVEVDS